MVRPYGLDRAKVNTGPVPEVNVEEYLRLMFWVRWHTRQARLSWARGWHGGSQERWAKSRRKQAQRLRAPAPL